MGLFHKLFNEGHVSDKYYSTLNHREQTHLLLKKMMVLEQKLKSMETKLKNVSCGVYIIPSSIGSLLFN